MPPIILVPSNIIELYVSAIGFLSRDEVFFDEAEEMEVFSEDTDPSDDDDELIKKMTRDHPAMKMLRKLRFGSKDDSTEAKYVLNI